MVAPRKYLPIKRCIYCGTCVADKRDATARFGDEHIIPLAFGGNLELPEASCRDCERITSKSETHCIENMLRNTREHFGLRARRHKRSRIKLPIDIRHDDTYTETRLVPLSEHPAVLYMFAFDPPGLILDIPEPKGAFSGRMAFRPMMSDLRARVDKLGGNVNFVRRGGFGAPIFGHMLAKIAHSYAVAELGIDSFKPILNNLIRGLPTLHMAQFVGGSFLPEPKSADLHEIGIKLSYRLDGRGFWVVRVRLFADLDMPAYYVVAGYPLS
jgi:hypothetical protein